MDSDHFKLDDLSLLRLLFKCIKCTQIYIINNNNNNLKYYVDIMNTKIINKLIEFCKIDYREINKMNNLNILDYVLKLIVRLLQNNNNNNINLLIIWLILDI